MTAAASPPLARELANDAALDRRLVAAVRRIRILPTVAWPPTLEQAFLALGDGAAPCLPQVRQRSFARATVIRQRFHRACAVPAPTRLRRTCGLAGSLAFSLFANRIRMAAAAAADLAGA